MLLTSSPTSVQGDLCFPPSPSPLPLRWPARSDPRSHPTHRCVDAASWAPAPPPLVDHTPLPPTHKRKQATQPPPLSHTSRRKMGAAASAARAMLRPSWQPGRRSSSHYESFALLSTTPLRRARGSGRLHLRRLAVTIAALNRRQHHHGRLHHRRHHRRRLDHLRHHARRRRTPPTTRRLGGACTLWSRLNGARLYPDLHSYRPLPLTALANPSRRDAPTPPPF